MKHLLKSPGFIKRTALKVLLSFFTLFSQTSCEKDELLPPQKPAWTTDFDIASFINNKGNITNFNEEPNNLEQRYVKYLRNKYPEQDNLISEDFRRGLEKYLENINPDIVFWGDHHEISGDEMAANEMLGSFKKTGYNTLFVEKFYWDWKDILENRNNLKASGKSLTAVNEEIGSILSDIYADTYKHDGQEEVMSNFHGDIHAIDFGGMWMYNQEPKYSKYNYENYKDFFEYAFNLMKEYAPDSQIKEYSTPKELYNSASTPYVSYNSEGHTISGTVNFKASTNLFNLRNIFMACRIKEINEKGVYIVGHHHVESVDTKSLLRGTIISLPNFFEPEKFLTIISCPLYDEEKGIIEGGLYISSGIGSDMKIILPFEKGGSGLTVEGALLPEKRLNNILSEYSNNKRDMYKKIVTEGNFLENWDILSTNDKEATFDIAHKIYNDYSK